MSLATHQYFSKWHTVSTLLFPSLYISSVCYFSALKHAAANEVAEMLEFILLLLVSQKKFLASSNGKFAIFETTFIAPMSKTSPEETKHTRLLADSCLSNQYRVLTYPGFKFSINCAYRDI